MRSTATQRVSSPDPDVPATLAATVTPMMVAPLRQRGGPWWSLGVQATFRTQLLLLALNIACCGGIVGLCRLLPTVASDRFNAQSHSAVLLFVCTFGLCKGLFNLVVGATANTFGRLALLRVGWVISTLVPLVLWYAGSWAWILVATALLGASQGLCTSCAVVMLLDLVPASSRGVALGALECLLYVSLGLGALGASELLVRTGGDFHAVLVVHLFLCLVAALVALFARETGTLVLKQHQGGAATDEEGADEAAEERGRLLHEDLEAGLPSRANASSSAVALALPRPTALTTSPSTSNPSPGVPDSTVAAGAGPFSLQLRGTQHHSHSADLDSLRSDAVNGHTSPPRNGTAVHDGVTDAASSMSFSASFRSSVRECISSSVLRAIIQAGFANNFKDGVAWGLLPAFFGATGIASSVSRNGSSPVINSHAVPASQLGALLTAYPLIWGLGQLFTGRASDRWGRGRFVFGGLLLQSLSLVGLVLVPVLLNRLAPMLLATPNDDVGVNDDVLSSVRFVLWMLSLSLLGVGTAMSYPVLQAYIGDVVAPARRASALGLYRLCRDLGYAFGGVGAGLAADRLGVDATFLLVGALLALSSFYAWICLPPDQQPPARRVASPSLPANVAHHKEDARQA